MSPLNDPREALRRALQYDAAEQNLTEHERQVITAYREKPNLQNAVDILLGIDK